ncbi:MAG TPA: LCP family protein [bacterium]|nr:LCP family protein [bacterium]HQA63799.1 LCP family protein [bacterium]
MEKIGVDFLPPEEKGSADKKIISGWKKIILSLIIVIIIVLAVFSSSVVFSDENLAKELSKFNLIGQLGKLIGGGDKELIGEDRDRLNVLLIGMGGRGHDGGTLADTIILGSFKPSTNEVAMMSIPRDLSIFTTKYGWIKVNAVHAYGEKENPGSGGKDLAEALSSLLGDEIHYYATVDFDGFEKIIDEFGGVDIEVERNLIDYQYPIRGKENIFPIENRFETLSIKKGLQHMDGELALKYARSRHALGIEGSDFARSRRQQKILVALKEKIFETKTFFSPRRINSLLSAYQDHIITNLQVWEIIRLAQIGKDIDITKIINQTLTDGPTGFLYADKVNGAYVLLPKDGNFETIKKIWQNIFYIQGEPALATGDNLNQTENIQTATETPILSAPPETETPTPVVAETPPTNDYQKENATIEIQNGTWVTGWAGQEKDRLKKLGFNITKAINAVNHDFAATIIYDLSSQTKPATAAELEKLYQTKLTAERPISFDSQADFVIILGK